MYNAYSKSSGKVVDIGSVYNIEQIFYCPNPNCPAELKIRSADGKLAKHFANLRGLKKHRNCHFTSPTKKYENDDNLVKKSLMDILGGTQKRKQKGKDSSPQENNSDGGKKPDKVGTVKQLFQFCISSSLEREYRDGLTLDDIILDSRNLLKENRILGVSGLRLLAGTTHKYDALNTTVFFSISTRSGDGFMQLNAKAILPADIFQEIVKTIRYTDETGAIKFAGKPIAVFGDWDNPESGKVVCTAEKQEQVIVKF